MGFAYASLPPITSGSQDGQGDFSTPGPTWHYRHVALCLNERKTSLGIATALSALPTEIRDDAITYTEINLARVMIKAMCVPSGSYNLTLFQKDPSVNYQSISLSNGWYTWGKFADVTSLLAYCGLAQSSWMNVLYGVVSYQENMQAGSTLVLKCIRELQLVVTKMTIRYGTMNFLFTGNDVYNPNPKATPTLAWNSRDLVSHGGMASLLVGLNGTSGSYTAEYHEPDAGFFSYSPLFPSLKRKVQAYVDTSIINGSFVDVFNGTITQPWTKGNSTTIDAGITQNVDALVLPPFSSWTQPPVGTNFTTTLGALQRFYTYDFTFTNDAQLYKNSY